MDAETEDRANDNQWYIILPKLQLRGMAQQLAEHCLLAEVDEKTVLLQLDRSGVTLQTDLTEAALKAALNIYFERELTLKFEVADSIGETPEQRRIRLAKERQQNAEQSITQDAFVKALQEQFAGIIVPGSVRPNAEDA